VLARASGNAIHVIGGTQPLARICYRPPVANRKAALSVLAALHPEEPGRDRRLVGFVRIRNPGARAASFDWPGHRDLGDGYHIAGTIMELIDA
jgi:hypothetical protein